jgi:hypothetical protein
MARVKHVALMRLKPEIGRAGVEAILRDLAGLKHKIPGLLDFSGGPYSSPEGLNKGFTHAFAMTFADAAARDAYLTHPDHEQVKDKIIPALDGGLDGVVVFDWEE